jgi:hypothetical protein
MRSGIQCPLDVLQGHYQQCRWLEPDFALLLGIAEEENVVPWVVERLRCLDADFSPQQKQKLDDLFRAAQFSAFVWAETLKATLDAFHRGGIPVITLKGPSLAERIYGDSSLRTCYDLDLLVRSDDVDRAEKLLGDIGFSPNGRADDYHRAFSRKSINLELHHNVENPLAFEFDIEGTWSRAIPSNFQGVPMLYMAPFDELLYLSLHAVRHRFERICLILDLTLAFRRLLLLTANTPHCSDPVFNNILVLGWMMAAHLDADIPALQMMRISSRDRIRLEKISDRLWQELMLWPQPALDWAAQHRFYIEVESPGWSRLRRRIRHQRILATRLIDEDFVFADRFHLRREWQARLLRPIRLLTKGRNASSETLSYPESTDSQ